MVLFVRRFVISDRVCRCVLVWFVGISRVKSKFIGWLSMVSKVIGVSS